MLLCCFWRTARGNCVWQNREHLMYFSIFCIFAYCFFSYLYEFHLFQIIYLFISSLMIITDIYLDLLLLTFSYHPLFGIIRTIRLNSNTQDIFNLYFFSLYIMNLIVVNFYNNQFYFTKQYRVNQNIYAIFFCYILLI